MYEYCHTYYYEKGYTLCTLYLNDALYAHTDIPRPSDVSACISYNATGFPHLNIQLKVLYVHA